MLVFQSGDARDFLTDEPLAAAGQIAFRPPLDFGVGSCRISGGITAGATWNFNVNGNLFNVGTVPLPGQDRADSWNFPVGFAQNGSLFGAAIHNPNGSAVQCRLSIFSENERADFELTQVSLFQQESRTDFDFEIPAQGQVSRFFGNAFAAPSGTLSFVNADLNCSEAVFPVLLTQDQRNGFPTPVEGAVVPD